MSSCGVIKFQAPFEKMKEFNFSPEVKLFKSIILQAIIDASNTSSTRKARKIELEAKNWLFGKSEYFKDVCYRANSTPDEVAKTAKAVIELNRNNNTWIGYKIYGINNRLKRN